MCKNPKGGPPAKLDMRPKDINEREEASRKLRSHQGYDPLQAARNESPSFNKSWLKNGESLNRIQRVGFALFSIAALMCGLYLCSITWEVLRAGDIMFLPFALASLFFLIPGVLGLKNVLRLKNNKPAP